MKNFITSNRCDDASNNLYLIKFLFILLTQKYSFSNSFFWCNMSLVKIKKGIVRTSAKEKNSD